MRWGIPTDREHVIGHHELFAEKDCPGNLDVDRLIRECREQPEDASATQIGLACLLPIRDGQADLPGYLESVQTFTDCVIAIDDGSRDGTSALLEDSPLVTTLLRNPLRGDYSGWRDDLNRQRLLDAAIEAGASWALFLDADERIPEDDARILREFVHSDAVVGCAYGLQLFRQWKGGVAATSTYLYRLFAPRRGQQLPKQRLHFNPIPVSIPDEAWLQTSIRVVHLDSPGRLVERRRKYFEADPKREFERGQSVLLSHPSGPIQAWQARPSGLPVLTAGGTDPGCFRQRERRHVSLACLLPARNCVADLPGYLESVGRFADFVIALDDGSTDETSALLQASPQVKRLLRSPRRDSYVGWDDATNRQRLLDAAVELGVDWALFLDADERIDESDGAALRTFVDTQANRSCAYGLRCFRMVGDTDHYDRAELWVYRLFAPAEDRRTLPASKLHLVPVPEEIPRSDWVRTTIRIKHLAGLDEARRTARLRKYDEADPGRVWQRDYRSLVEAPHAAYRWHRRPPGFPIHAGHDGGVDLVELDLDAPMLSAIVIARDDEATIERSLRSVVEQESDYPFEVIAAVSGSDRTAEIVRSAFPSVRLVSVPEPGLPGMARNAGLAVARGDYVSFPGSHVELPPGSLEARIRAHELGYAMVTGTILNGTTTRSGWASYFLDHAACLPERPSGELEEAPAHCSYVREFLLEVGGFPEGMRAGEDTVANMRLWERGRLAYRARDVRLIHRSRCRSVWRLLRHHFQRGRALGSIMLSSPATERPNRIGSVRYLMRYPRQRLADTDGRVLRWGGSLEAEYRRSRGLVRLAIRAACLGAMLEVMRPGAAPAPSLAPAPRLRGSRRAGSWSYHGADRAELSAPSQHSLSA